MGLNLCINFIKPLIKEKKQYIFKKILEKKKLLKPKNKGPKSSTLLTSSHLGMPATEFCRNLFYLITDTLKKHCGLHWIKRNGE